MGLFEGGWNDGNAPGFVRNGRENFFFPSFFIGGVGN